MTRKLIVIFLSGVISLLGITAALAYNEAPMLRTLVAAGELPPIEERLPEEPFVEEPFEEIGRYGGTLQVLAVNPNIWNDVQLVRGPTLTSLFEPSRDGEYPVPNIAKGFKFSEDFKTLTIYLRKGLKWSDGYPFTAEDILFVINDVYQNKELTPTPPFWLFPTKEIEKAEKVDEYTVNIKFPEPYPAFEASLWSPRMGQLCTAWPAGIYAPKHYLKRWHIKYNPEADELAKEEGYEYWWQAYRYHAQIFPQQSDIDLPQMLPWVLKTKITNVKVFERNPYYWKVDTAGNQLPYIDKVVSTIVDTEVYQIKAISGEADFVMLQLSFQNYTLYKESEEKGDYRVIEYPGINGSELSIWLNLNEPNLVLRKIYQDVRFRRALSVAIDRDDINESIFFGKAIPRQHTWHPDFPLPIPYKKEWAEAYAQYDTGLANQLLDEMGLTKKDKDGWRLGPDGEPVFILLEYTEIEGPRGAICELVKEYWEAVGIKVVLKVEERALYSTRMKSADHGTWTWAYQAVYAEGHPARNWQTWMNTEGKEGEEPLEEWKDFYKWTMIQGNLSGEERREVFGKLGDSQAENLWAIGAVGMAPALFIVKSNLGNVLDLEQVALYSMAYYGTKYPEQMFFKK